MDYLPFYGKSQNHPRAIMQLSTRNFTIRLLDDGALQFSLANGQSYTQEPSAYPVENRREEDGAIAYDLRVGTLLVHGRITIQADQEFMLELSGEGALTEPLAYPPPWRPHSGDTAIIPYYEGLAIPVEDATALKYFPDNGALTFHPQLGFFALLNDGLCLGTAMENADDALLSFSRNAEGLVVQRAVWQSVKGQFAYARRLRYLVHGTLSAAARRYRRLREEQGGFVVTLKEKLRRTPEVAKLLGAADVWIWDDNNMNRLYARPESSEITPRDSRRVADEMLARGMSRILWNAFEGEAPEDCRALKEKGFLVGKYDIYRDVLPKPLVDVAIPYRRDRSVNTRHWPGIVRIDEKGNYVTAWQISGKDGTMYDQHAVCEICALRLTMENVPPDVERVGYTSRLIDVQAGSAPQECYAPLHPATRSDSLRYINAQNRFLADIGLVVGVEVGQEACVRDFHYSEGLMSIGYYRAEESGRRMCTQYYGSEIPRQFTEAMLNPAIRLPLWELIYHDCAVSYWYWGDSSNSAPELMPLRDLFDALYGQPPLYSLNMTQWDRLKEEIACSYHRATKVAALTATAAMSSFEWLTADRMVQRTVFANGVSVVVNFSQRPYEAGERTVAPQSALVQTPAETFII